jgi:hypothetical protein
MGSPNGWDLQLLTDKTTALKVEMMMMMMVVVAVAGRGNIQLMCVPNHSGEPGIPNTHKVSISSALKGAEEGKRIHSGWS